MPNPRMHKQVLDDAQVRNNHCLSNSLPSFMEINLGPSDFYFYFYFKFMFGEGPL